MEFSLALPNVSPGLVMIDEKREKDNKANEFPAKTRLCHDRLLFNIS